MTTGARQRSLTPQLLRHIDRKREALKLQPMMYPSAAANGNGAGNGKAGAA